MTDCDGSNGSVALGLPRRVTAPRRSPVSTFGDWSNLYQTRTRLIEITGVLPVRSELLRGDQRRVYFAIWSDTAPIYGVLPSDFTTEFSTRVLSGDMSMHGPAAGVPLEIYVAVHGAIVTAPWDLIRPDPVPAPNPVIGVMEVFLTGGEIVRSAK